MASWTSFVMHTTVFEGIFYTSYTQQPWFSFVVSLYCNVDIIQQYQKHIIHTSLNIYPCKIFVGLAALTATYSPKICKQLNTTAPVLKFNFYTRKQSARSDHFLGHTGYRNYGHLLCNISTSKNH